MSRIRVGFVGAGARATGSHYPAVANLPELAEMAAVCDLDEERLNAAGDRWGIDARFTDLHEMLAQVELDAVYCVAPPTVLREMVMPCLEAGRHVFTEKPLGMNAAEAEEMARVARDHDCITMVGFNRRFAAVIDHCRRLVAQRGGPTQVVAEFHKDMLGGPPYYDMSIVIMDVIHAIDLIRHLCGEPRAVHSAVRRMHNDWDNVFNALLTFDGRHVALLSANRASGARYERFELHGRGISCYIRAPERAEIFIDDAAEPEIVTGEGLTGSDDPNVTYGFYAESEHFLTCVRDGVPTSAGFDDAVLTMRLCEAVEEGTL